MSNTKNKKYWDEVATQLRKENYFSNMVYRIWFSGLKYAFSTENTITIVSPPEYYNEHLSRRYGILLEYKLFELSGRRIKLNFHIVDEPFNPSQKLNEDYSFDNYIVGEHNKIATGIGKNVAEDTLLKYNFTIIYGEPRVGKTHLLQAIANEINQRTKGLKVIYTRSDDFVSEFIEAVQRGSTGNFKNKYRHIDVLLLDDIQDFARKNLTQDELFHTLITLLDFKKQIVLTSNQQLKDLNDVSDRLRSILERGIEVELAYPDLESRIKILQKMASN